MSELDHDALQKAYASLGDYDCPLLGVAIKTYVDALLKPMKDAPEDGTLIEAFFQHGCWNEGVFVPYNFPNMDSVNRWIVISYYHSKIKGEAGTGPAWWEHHSGIFFGNQKENSFLCWRPYIDPRELKL